MPINFALYSTIMELKPRWRRADKQDIATLYSTIMELKLRSYRDIKNKVEALYSTIMELKQGNIINIVG